MPEDYLDTKKLIKGEEQDTLYYTFQHIFERLEKLEAK